MREGSDGKGRFNEMALLDERAGNVVVRRSNLREILHMTLFDGHTKGVPGETREYVGPRAVWRNPHSKRVAATAYKDA
jgi:hypothetical protein